MSNYSLTATGDITTFQQFMIDYTRIKTEVDEEGTLQTPFEIYEHIGEISFMGVEFRDKVKKKFITKKNKNFNY